jgi:hypothetical protein
LAAQTLPVLPVVWAHSDAQNGRDIHALIQPFTPILDTLGFLCAEGSLDEAISRAGKYSAAVQALFQFTPNPTHTWHASVLDKAVGGTSYLVDWFHTSMDRNGNDVAYAHPLFWPITHAVQDALATVGNRYPDLPQKKASFRVLLDVGGATGHHRLRMGESLERLVAAYSARV